MTSEVSSGLHGWLLPNSVCVTGQRTAVHVAHIDQTKDFIQHITRGVLTQFKVNHTVRQKLNMTKYMFNKLN